MNSAGAAFLDSLRTDASNEPPPEAPALLCDLAETKAACLLLVSPPPRLYVIEKLLPEPVAAAIVAPGGTGKSFVLMQAASCVASGMPFMGHAIRNPGAVLMLAAEDDTNELTRRLHSIADHMRAFMSMTPQQEHALGQNLHLVSRLGIDNRITIKTRGFIEWDLQFIERLVETALAIPNLRLIILDPVSRFRSGDENSSEDATKFVEALEIIRQVTGVTVLCTHHSRKGSTGESQDDIRGASAFVDALRFAATLYTPSATEAIKLGIDQQHARSWVRMAVVKSNYQTDVDQLWMKRGIGGVLIQQEPPIAQVSNDQKTEERYRSALPKLKDLIREADIQGEPLTKTAITRNHSGKLGRFSMGDQLLRQVITKAIEDGEIKQAEDGGLRLY